MTALSEWLTNFRPEYGIVFGVLLTFGCYIFGDWVYKRLGRFPLFNPSIIATASLIFILVAFDVDFDYFYEGGIMFTYMLFPTTVALGVPIYRQRALIRDNFLPIMVGAGVGAFVGMGSVWVLCRLFGLSDFITHSLLAKSVTSPIAMEVSTMLGGDPSLVLLGVCIAGLMSSFTLPLMIRYLKLKNHVATGIGTGTSSHGMGTSVAMGIDEEIGAMSGIAIGIAGLYTVLFALIIPW